MSTVAPPTGATAIPLIKLQTAMRHRKAHPNAKLEPVITSIYEAVTGEIEWGLAGKHPIHNLADVARCGHALAVFDGDRRPAVQKCIGCSALTSLAWSVKPAGITVAACCGDCVADRVEKEWVEIGASVFFRVRGESALSLAPVDSEPASGTVESESAL